MIKLHYFNGHGRVDAIKFTLDTVGAPYEMIGHDHSDWATDKEDQTLFPFKQMPVIETKSGVLHQTRAIINFYCSLKGWMPQTPEEVYLDNWYFDTLSEFLETYWRDWVCNPDPEKKEKGGETFLNEKAPLVFTEMEAKFTERPGRIDHYLVSDQFTPAFFHAVSVLNVICYDGPRSQEVKPLLAKHAPFMKKWVESKTNGEFASYFKDTSKRPTSQW
mmetsp:Transcript_29942/g.34016  ORF Transcript_29942/g.34016 Transcript_29942/m.34016 type:complete len:218 (+) Transcript_29942:145-798(+)